MTFRAFNQKYLEPFFELLMIFGIIALCQPWVEPLHRYGLTIILIGLVGFSVVIKIPREESQADEGSK